MGFHGMRGNGMATYLEEQKKRGRKTDARTVRRVAAAFKPYIPQVILVLIAILLTTVLGLVNPLLVKPLIWWSSIRLLYEDGRTLSEIWDWACSDQAMA